MSFPKYLALLNSIKCILALFPIKLCHYSFLPTGYACGSVGGALGRVSGSRVEYCLFQIFGVLEFNQMHTGAFSH